MKCDIVLIYRRNVTIVVLFEFFVWHTKGQYSLECNQREN